MVRYLPVFRITSNASSNNKLIKKGNGSMTGRRRRTLEEWMPLKDWKIAYCPSQRALSVAQTPAHLLWPLPCGGGGRSHPRSQDGSGANTVVGETVTLLSYQAWWDDSSGLHEMLTLFFQNIWYAFAPTSNIWQSLIPAGGCTVLQMECWLSEF